MSDASLAPAGKHVLSAYVQFAPFKLRAHVVEAASAGKTGVRIPSIVAPRTESSRR